MCLLQENEIYTALLYFLYGFCFSSDGKLFINIERQKDDLPSAISVYNSADFSLISQVLLGDDMMAGCIEFDQNTDAYYILGFMRDSYSLVMATVLSQNLRITKLRI